MATNFPTSLDSLTNPTSSDSLNSPSHSAQHANVNDAVEALQAKVGADSSAVTSSLDYKVAQLEAISHGKILQVVRATDSTARLTTSTSFVDASISVTITPTSATSDVMLLWAFGHDNSGGNPERGSFQITDTSNVAISGAEELVSGNASANNHNGAIVVVGYDSPATTSATTYKGRFRSASGGTTTRVNSDATGQLFAIEVGA